MEPNCAYSLSGPIYEQIAIGNQHDKSTTQNKLTAAQCIIGVDVTFGPSVLISFAGIPTVGFAVNLFLPWLGHLSPEQTQVQLAWL